MSLAITTETHKQAKTHTSHLKLFLEEGEDCARDEASDAATVDGQHRHLPRSKSSHGRTSRSARDGNE